MAISLPQLRPRFFVKSLSWSQSVYSRDACAVYNYRVLVPAAGEYDVILWWTEWSSRIASVTVDVVADGSTATRFVDQTRDGGKWISLGDFSATANLVVRIRSPGGGSTCADAARVAKAP